MNDYFPVIILVIGAISFFSFTVRLRRFRVSEKSPASSVGLSIEQRQKRMRIASWVSFCCGCLMLASAAYFAWNVASH
jgi:hypothetical protein